MIAPPQKRSLTPEPRRIHAEQRVTLMDVPPWSYLVPGVAIDQATANAAVALGIREHWAVIGLYWDMRRFVIEMRAKA